MQGQQGLRCGEANPSQGLVGASVKIPRCDTKGAGEYEVTVTSEGGKVGLSKKKPRGDANAVGEDEVTVTSGLCTRASRKNKETNREDRATSGGATRTTEDWSEPGGKY